MRSSATVLATASITTKAMTASRSCPLRVSMAVASPQGGQYRCLPRIRAISTAVVQHHSAKTDRLFRKLRSPKLTMTQEVLAMFATTTFEQEGHLLVQR